jgi:hypothetical protein
MKHIAPVGEGLPQLDRHPPIVISRAKRWLITLAEPWFRRRNEAWQLAKQRQLTEIMAAARECDSREELERILGKPRYALDGLLCGRHERDGTKRSPEIVEVYQVAGCTVELWFFAVHSSIDMVGFTSPTSTSLVLSHLDSERSAHKAG